MSRPRHLERERQYQRRVRVCLVASALLNALLLVTLPADEESLRSEPRVAQPGPLRVLPELDIIPEVEDDSRKTAAPSRLTPPADFVAMDMEIAEQSMPRVPEPWPEPVPESVPKPDPFQFQTVEDLQMEVSTTGHPVLAQADIQLIHLERPAYPREAVLANIEGTVDLMILVDARGRVTHVYVVNPRRWPLLEDAAVAAISQSLFRPYLVDGTPTPFWVRIPVEFDLVE